MKMHFLKKKVKSLKKDLYSFVKRKRKLNAFLGVEKSFYDKGGVALLMETMTNIKIISL